VLARLGEMAREHGAKGVHGTEGSGREERTRDGEGGRGSERGSEGEREGGGKGGRCRERERAIRGEREREREKELSAVEGGDEGEAVARLHLVLRAAAELPVGVVD